MTVLDSEIHGKPHFPGGLRFAVAVLTLILLVSLAMMAQKPADPVPVPIATGDICAEGAPGCEMQWMLENLSQIEHPVLILAPEAH